MTTEPTDAEIIALADETRTGEPGREGYILPISFARAVLEKWGQPAHSGEPAAWLSPWRADQVTTDYDAYGERGIPLVRQHPLPVEREPLTDEKKNAMWVAATIELPSPQNCYLRGMADAERAHGIGIKGGQHGTE